MVHNNSLLYIATVRYTEMTGFGHAVFTNRPIRIEYSTKPRNEREETSMLSGLYNPFREKLN